MKLTFDPDDWDFQNSLVELRRAVIGKKPFAPRFFNIIVDGRAVEAKSARVGPDGLFWYTTDAGEHRVELARVGSVEVYF